MLDGDTFRHLSSAIRLYNDQRKIDGLRPVLADLAGAFAVYSGERRPKVDGADEIENIATVALLYDYETAGELLSLSSRTVRRLVSEGEIRAVSIGGARRIHRTDLQGFAESLREQGEQKDAKKTR